MKRTVRSVLGVSAGVLLAGVSACATPSGDTKSEQPSDTAQQAKALEGFDPCAFYNSQELQSWGVSTESQDATAVSFEPGCRWEGEALAVSMHKNVDETVASYGQSGSWDSYQEKAVAGRSAAVGVEAGAQDAGGCSVLVDSGGGVVIYGASGMRSDSVDACAQAEKLAEETAPRLPE